jgi:hypothetical protein
MIPSSGVFDQSTMTQLLTHDPVVADYRALFSLFDWSLVQQWQEQRSSRGRPPHPESAYLKAFLIRLNEGLIYTSQLRDYLVKHPLLVIELGFHLELDPLAPYGFDVEHTLPCRFWLGQKLRQFDHSLLQALLHATVAALQEEIAGLGETVAFDVKHISAWVKENNERVYVKDRYNKEQQLAGDPVSRLGVKRSSNQEQPDGTRHARKKSTCGATAQVWLLPPHLTMGMWCWPNTPHPESENDITDYRPLYQQAVVALNQFPTHVTADAAFDAWYVYEDAVRLGGIAAVPLNQHGHPVYERDADGVPRCPIGLRMPPTYQFDHTYGYRAKPLLLPLALSREDRSYVRAPAVGPRQELCQGCQCGTWWTDARHR